MQLITLALLFLMYVVAPVECAPVGSIRVAHGLEAVVKCGERWMLIERQHLMDPAVDASKFLGLLAGNSVRVDLIPEQVAAYDLATRVCRHIHGSSQSIMLAM